MQDEKLGLGDCYSGWGCHHQGEAGNFVLTDTVRLLYSRHRSPRTSNVSWQRMLQQVTDWTGSWPAGMECNWNGWAEELHHLPGRRPHKRLSVCGLRQLLCVLVHAAKYQSARPARSAIADAQRGKHNVLH